MLNGCITIHESGVGKWGAGAGTLRRFLLGVMAVLPWFMIWLEPESLGCTSVLLSPFSSVGILLEAVQDWCHWLTPHHWANPISPPPQIVHRKVHSCDSSPYLRTSFCLPSAVCSATRELAMATSAWSLASSISLKCVHCQRQYPTSILVGSSAGARGWSRCSMVSSLRRRK